MNKVCAFTVCSNNYISYAKVLFSSLRRFYPEWDLFLCLVDGINGNNSTEYKTIAAKSLDIVDFHTFCFKYSLLELNTAVKPFMFLKLFGEFSYYLVLYFDPLQSAQTRG